MPVEKDAFYSMLGIARRAGVLMLGEGGVLKAIASGTAKLVLLDAGASENTQKRFRDSCRFYGVTLLETEAGRLGESIGKPGRMSAAVAGGTLCDKLASLAAEDACPTKER